MNEPQYLLPPPINLTTQDLGNVRISHSNAKIRGSSISTSLGKAVSELRRAPLSDLARAFGTSKKRKKGVSQGGEVEVPFSRGYDAQQAKCAPAELDQTSRGRISKHKVMSEDVGGVGIARGTSCK